MTAAQDPRQIRLGIDVLLERQLGEWHGARIGLLTGAAGVTADLVPTILALRECPGARLVCLFSAEHGLYGAAAAGESIASTADPYTGLPVHSLYGKTREPAEETLRALDVVFVDLQDIGLRYYTYPATVHALLRRAASAGRPVVVLDRPAPLTGTLLEGPLTERAFQSFVSTPITPIRHGLTLGELALWMNERVGIGADVRVVEMQGWRRDLWFDQTGLQWVPPSPNIPTLASGLAYSATCLVEGTTVSEGRGTTQPFEVIGAPWIQGHALADQLNRWGLAGARFRPVSFRPTASKHAQQFCSGVQLHITDRSAFEGVRTGLQILATLWALYPEHLAWVRDPSGQYFIDLLLGTDVPRRAVERGEAIDAVVAGWNGDIAAFKEARGSTLLY
jgi:uncharacterized protein YbbC (DUF1343 family)